MVVHRRRTAADSEARLESFFARELGAPEELLKAPGVHVLASPNRERASWHGYTLPVLLLGHAGSVVISVERALLARVREVASAAGETLDPEAAGELLRPAEERHPQGKALSGYALYCEPGEFTPRLDHPTDELKPSDSQWDDMRYHFDGPVFVARAEGGDVTSWAGIKCKDEHVWEIAVVTEEAYRRRGLARVVVSAATRYILEHGAVPLYVHPSSNEVSGRVARGLGYRQFAREAYVSVSDSDPTGMW